MILTRKPRRRYYSYSRCSLYYNNPEAYAEKYVLGVEPEETRNMLLGKIGHEALKNPNGTWRKKLRNNRFSAEEEYRIDRALEQIELPPKRNREVKVLVQPPNIPIPLYGIWDRYERGILGEYKFAASGSWNKEKADEDLQLDFYDYMFVKQFQTVPKIVLYHVLPTGRVNVIDTIKKRTNLQRRGVENYLEHCHRGISNRVWE